MNERIDEQPYDDRHSSPGRVPAMAEHEVTFNPGSSCLSFQLSGGYVLHDIGRGFGRPDALENVHEVDLRTILAHLDAAARAIKSELDARFAPGMSR